jgi:hypothetical protein
MKNISLEPVFLSMQESINNVLSEYVKALVANSDYDSLSAIAEIGKKTNTFLDELCNSVHPNSVSDVVEAVKPNTEVINSRLYSIDIQSWICNYLFKRNGRALKTDVLESFFKEFGSEFSPYDYEKVGDAQRWETVVWKKVGRLRKNGMITPFSSGHEYNYWRLTPDAHNRLKQEQAKSTVSEKQLPLPSMGIDA